MPNKKLEGLILKYVKVTNHMFKSLKFKQIFFTFEGVFRKHGDTSSNWRGFTPR